MKVLPMHISVPSKRRGVAVSLWERGGWGLLSEAHNLIIQSIEQHIHFIVLQISPNSLGSSEAPRIEQSCFMFLKRSCRWDLHNDQPRVPLLPFYIAPHCQVWWYDFSSEHHVISNSKWYKDDTNMRGRCLAEMFWAVWSPLRQSWGLLWDDAW